jgi:excisionase family DNA binding protein
VFDHSARVAEHLQNLPLLANPCFSGRFLAPGQLFGIFVPNAAPTVMLAAPCGKRSAGATIMVPTDLSAPLALRPREAAKALGISPRLLWQLTKDGHVPCVRVGSGTRKTVLYPVADLQAWLTRQAATAKGGEQ